MMNKKNSTTEVIRNNEPRKKNAERANGSRVIDHIQPRVKSLGRREGKKNSAPSCI